MSELHWTSAVDLADSVRSGARSAVSVLEAHLDRIRSVEPQVHAFLRLTEEEARASAAAVDVRVAAGDDPPQPLALPPGQAAHEDLHLLGGIAVERNRLARRSRGLGGDAPGHRGGARPALVQ